MNGYEFIIARYQLRFCVEYLKKDYEDSNPEIKKLKQKETDLETIERHVLDFGYNIFPELFPPSPFVSKT